MLNAIYILHCLYSYTYRIASATWIWKVLFDHVEFPTDLCLLFGLFCRSLYLSRITQLKVRQYVLDIIMLNVFQSVGLRLELTLFFLL